MKYFLSASLFVLASLFTVVYATPVADNPPTAMLTSPVAGQTFFGTNMVLLSAIASDTDGTVVSVEFFVNNVLVGTDTSAPYRTGAVLPLGRHTVTVSATDNDGNVSVYTVEVAVYDRLIDATLSTPLRL